jgi:cytochrome P450
MNASDAAESWAEHNVRHFRRMFYGVAALFAATQVAALSGLVPHLRPVSFQAITTNILFAIGFGCPLVLYLSSLPRPREIGVAAAAGAALALGLWGVQQGIGLPAGVHVQEVASAQVVTGLGLACLGVLALRAWRTTGPPRTAALVYLLPACVALIYTFEAGVFLYFVKGVFPRTYDGSAYAADTGYGFAVSFAVGRLFAALPALKWVCFILYVAPPPALVFVYALQIRARRPPPVDVVTVLLVLALTGYSFYFLYPVCGPLFAFGDAFPNAPPPASEFLGQRLTVAGADAWPNGMPSLHFASVLLAYWHARPYGRWARAAAAVFVIGTVLATLGLGEHYLVDLVVALPFTLAIHAACTPPRPGLRRPRRAALLGSAALVAAWYVLLFYGIPLLLISPVAAWGATLGTVAAVVYLERRLYRAAFGEAEKASAPTTAPGPRGRWLLGNLLEFRRDVLRLMIDGQRSFGDVVCFRLGPMVLHLVSHPDHIRHVLLTRHDNYNKDTRSSAKIRSITGEGLLTSSGPFWLRQRRLMQAAFSPARLACFAEVMAQATAEMLGRWRKRTEDGQPLDIASEMQALTFTIVGKALFGADLGGEAEVVERSSSVILEHSYHRLEKLIEWPGWVPTPRNRRFRRAMIALDRIVHRLITERRHSSTASSDLLSLLLRACEEETSGQMTDEQLRNETLTLLLAGHETTANALTWTWYLLSKHPAVRRRLAAEVAQVLGDRVPTADDLSGLTWTRMVIQEAMRLYPPIWAMERRALEDDNIAGYRIPRGSTVVISPYVTHRRLDFWDNPEGFDPERFLPEQSAARPHYAYIPFGGGQRLCIGNNFALLEAQIIVAMVMRAYRLDLVPGLPVEPKAEITLRSRHGLWMTLHPAPSQEPISS